MDTARQELKEHRDALKQIRKVVKIAQSGRYLED
jgi:hypothetical protein